METSNEKSIQKFPKKLRRILETLILEGVGVCRLSPNIIKNEINGQLDRLRFNLDVPYAGKHLNWEVIFDDEDEKFAPDFNFINDHFLADVDIDVIENHIPSLANWSLDRGDCLVRVINEFLIFYKKYQLELLLDSKFQRELMEYNLLTGDVGVDSEKVEVYVDGQENVHFLIGIDIDTEELPPYLQPSNKMEIINPREDFVTLKVSFTNTRVSTSVQLSPRLESIIGALNQLQIPPFHKDSGLTEYVPGVIKIIQGKLQTITRNFKLRKEYIATLQAYQGASILEYDCSLFLKATLLLAVEDIYAVVVFILSKNFPQENPTIQLLSIQYERNNIPVMQEYTKYPYDPTSCPESMIQKSLLFVSELIKDFKQEEQN